MSDPESANKEAIIELATSFEVRRVNLMMSAKRTIKVGDEFRSYESSVAWTLAHPTLEAVSPEVAKAVGLVFAPMLVRKVITDLVVGGVMTSGEAKDAIQRAESSYKQPLEGKRQEKSHGVSENQGDLRGDRPDVSGPPAEPAARV